MDTEVKTEPEVTIIKPQEGFQETFLSSVADIAIGGGAAGSGKTWGLTAEALYDIEKPRFRAIYFRRKLVDLDGLINEGQEVYSKVIPKPEYTDKKWTFPSGANISYSHLQYEKDKYNHQGLEYALICFDELTLFLESQFIYLLSRNRTTSGAMTRMRATCNPDPDSWVLKLITWWIGEDGFPIENRTGKLRYFVAKGEHVEDFLWGDTKEEVYLKDKDNIDSQILKAKKKGAVIKKEDFIKSLTFIPGSVFENAALLKKDPGYVGGLNAQDEVNKARLLDGNWKIKKSGKELVNADKFEDMLNRYPQTNGRKAITCDVAMKGSDKMVVFVWDGFHLIDCMVVDRSNGAQVIGAINSMKSKWHVQARNIVYDGNNMGSFIDGFIIGAQEFLNNAAPKNGEYYRNLKSQCADKWANRMNGILGYQKGLNYSIDSKLAMREFNGVSLLDHLILERKAMRWSDDSVDGKLTLIKKSEMKHNVGHSPDYIETMFMLEFLYMEDEQYSGHILW
jgi:hypothetical protein